VEWSGRARYVQRKVWPEKSNFHSRSQKGEPYSIYVLTVIIICTQDPVILQTSRDTVAIAAENQLCFWSTGL
jgi:hypothetical protein